MKKVIYCFLFTLLISLSMITIVNASSSITYFYAEPIKIDNKNIEIVSNEMEIDTTTSKITSEYLIKNTSNESVSIDIVIPIESKELSITVSEVKILLDNTNVDYTVNDNGEYVVKTKIQPNYGKKIKISYKTDNDLLKAKVIKYNMQNFNNRIIGKVKVDIKIREKDIPLVKGIYPGHFTFENNTISVEYCELKTNTITKEIIVEKETYYNIQYGRDSELSEYDNIILSRVDDWLENGISIDYTYNSIDNYYNYNSYELYNKMLNKSGEFYEYDINSWCKEILEYAVQKQIMIDKKVDIGIMWMRESNPIIRELKNNYDYKNNDGSSSRELIGKTICLHYVESEQDKDLYVRKNLTKSEEPQEKDLAIVPTTEREVLKTRGSGNHYAGTRGARIIYVGEGINGEDLGATDEEVVDYINSINADLYVRVVLFSGDIEPIKKIYQKIGYYNSEDYEIAKAFTNASMLKYNMSLNMSDYEFYNAVLVKLDNSAVSKCEIPTVAQFIGALVKENGKYRVNFFGDDGLYEYGGCGIGTTSSALATSRSQELIEKNRENNENKKNNVEAKITNLRYENNEEQIQTEIKEEIQARIKAQEEENKVDAFDINSLLNVQNLIILLIVECIFIFVLIIIIIKKRGKVNGREK